MKNFRTLTKVTNLPKVVIPTYNNVVNEKNYSNGNRLVITFFPKHNGKQNFVTLQVFDSANDMHFHKNIHVDDAPELENVDKQNNDFMDIDFIKKTIASCEENICSLDFKNLNTENIVNYGCANGWGKDKDTPLLDKYSEDRKNMPWLCVYCWESSLGRCWHKYTNYTYGYCYDVDSSD